MTRSDLLKNPAFWVTKIQMELYGCAERFMQKLGVTGPRWQNIWVFQKDMLPSF